MKEFLKQIQQDGRDPFREPWVLDHDGTWKFATKSFDCCQCLTRRRGGGHWITNRGRRLTKQEMMRLQGMVPEDFKVTVSEAQWGNQIGNSMSVNVLERILVRLLPKAGLVGARKRLVDRWQKSCKFAPPKPEMPKKRSHAELGKPVLPIVRTSTKRTKTA